MIISEKFLKSTTILATIVSASPTALIPDNCHTVQILNASTVDSLYVAIGSAGDPLSPTGAGGDVPLVIPPLSVQVISMGSLRLRPQAKPDGSSQLIYATSANTIQVNISYFCSIEL